MSYDDELRGAFERASSTPPSQPVDRVEAVHGRARRIRRRRAVLAGGTSLLVVAAGIGIAMPLLAQEPTQRLVQAASPSPSESDLPAGPVPTASPTSAPTTAPPPTSRPTPTPVIVPTTTPSPPPVEWYSIDVRASTDADPDYPLTTMTVHIKGLVSGGVNSVQFNYDNNHNRLDGDGRMLGCSSDGAVRPVDMTLTYHNYYRRAIVYYPSVIVWTGPCHAGVSANSKHWQGAFRIRKGSPHSNGRVQPTVTLSNTTTDGTHLGLDLTAYDFDGNIQTVSIDWGDGDAPVTSTSASCNDWQGDWWPYGYQTGHYTSRTLPPGTYHVKVTVISAGCDGGDQQTATATWDATVGT